MKRIDTVNDLNYYGDNLPHIYLETRKVTHSAELSRGCLNDLI